MKEKSEIMHLFIKKDYLTSVSKEELATLMHLMKLLNSLECWLRLITRLQPEENELFQFRNFIEIIFVLISLYNEGIKAFSNKLFRKILMYLDLSNSLKDQIIEAAKRYENYENDTFLKISNIIRNKIKFHFYRDFIEDNIKDGKAEKDIEFGIAIGNTLNDFMFLEPYTFEFQYIANFLPENIEKAELTNWLQNQTIIEVDKFSSLLRSIITSHLKGKSFRTNEPQE